MYLNTKVYFDGSHYIAIPHTTKPKRLKKKKVVESENVSITPTQLMIEEDLTTTESFSPTQNICETKEPDLNEVFNTLWNESLELDKGNKMRYLNDNLRTYFEDSEKCDFFIQRKLEQKKNNLINRLKRFRRKAYNNEFNFFATFTYADKKHDEDSFRKVLRKTLMNFHTRKGWKYIGVWEHAPKTKRLHFHCILFIPENSMPGEMIEVNDYDKKHHKRQITIQNTYFNDRFGRSAFEQIDSMQSLKGFALNYLIKYIAKTEERLVYSRNLPMYMISDIFPHDIACPYGIDDKKLLLFDDFSLIDEGTVLGKVTKDTKREVRGCNN